MGAFENFVNTELPLRISVATSPGGVRYLRFTGVGKAVEARTAAQLLADIAAAAASHAHAAGEITSGTLAKARGGLATSIAALAAGDILAGDGSGNITIVAASGAADGDVPMLQADGSLAFETPPGATGGIENVVEDTTPELGGNLDAGGFEISNVGNVDGVDVSGLLATVIAVVVNFTNHANDSANPHGVQLDDLASPDDNTDLDVSTSAHGLCPKLPDDSGKLLNGAGSWVDIPEGGEAGSASLARPMMLMGG